MSETRLAPRRIGIWILQGVAAAIFFAAGATKLADPNIWFYNIGGPLDWKLPIAPVPQLNNRKLNVPLGHVLGGGSENRFDVALPPPLRLTFDATQGRKSDHACDHT